MIDWGVFFDPTARIFYNIIYFAVIIGMIIIVISDNRNPVKTIAWILVLLFLPIIGIVFYVFFGRSQRKERIINKKSLDSLLKKPRAEYLSQNTVKVSEDEHRLSQFFSKTNLALTFEGKEVDISIAGYSILTAQTGRAHVGTQDTYRKIVYLLSP